MRAECNPGDRAALTYFAFDLVEVDCADVAGMTYVAMALKASSGRESTAYICRAIAACGSRAKCLNPAEFIIVGSSDPEGSRHAIGALLLGYCDADNRLLYAGRAGNRHAD